MVWRLAAPRSASTRVTRWPSRPSARARLTAIVLLPTPPLPPATAMMRGTAGLRSPAMRPPRPEPQQRDAQGGLDLIDHADQRVEQRRRGGEVVSLGARPAAPVVRAIDLALGEQRHEAQRRERGGQALLDGGEPRAGVAALDQPAR